MKTRAEKQEILDTLTAGFQHSKSAMVVSFNKLTVAKDQEFRNQLRDVGAKYQVVKNTLARLAVKGTQLEGATDHFKGVTAVAWTDTDPVVLSKTVSKFVKDNAEVFTFKVGVVDGRVVDLKQVEELASLPSKEVLISRILFLLNAPAQRVATVINAVPRNLAIVIKQIGDAKPETTQPEQKTAEPAVAEKAEEAAPAEEAKQEETATAAPEAAAETQEEQAPTLEAESAASEETPAAAPEAEEKSEE
ncbi:MAG TPA: 50S ribosomal protein L10 [Pyrinomonadaceae bacterium]|nr:50S ribosomal protein L10 [Pyrinomonadaceae bacterium]